MGERETQADIDSGPVRLARVNLGNTNDSERTRVLPPPPPADCGFVCGGGGGKYYVGGWIDRWVGGCLFRESFHPILRFGKATNYVSAAAAANAGECV